MATTTRTAEVRPTDWAGLSPTTVGLIAGGTLAIVSIVLSQGLGWGDGTPLELRFWRDPRGWFDALLAALFGWTLGGAVALVRGARRDLEALRPALRAGTALPEVGMLPRRSLRGAAVAGGILGLAINGVPGNWPEGFPGLTDPFFVWATLRTVLVSWAICRTGVIAAVLSARFAQVGSALRVEDLLDLRPLAPLGRSGLRNVAVWVGITVFLAVMLIAPFGRSVTGGSIVASALIGVVAFVGPVQGARRRLVEARDAELDRVRVALRARLEGTLVHDVAWAELSLADLLAWEARLLRVRTWPFDTPTVLRFGIYVLIGLCSWIGAALVERALGAALG